MTDVERRTATPCRGETQGKNAIGEARRKTSGRYQSGLHEGIRYSSTKGKKKKKGGEKGGKVHHDLKRKNRPIEEKRSREKEKGLLLSVRWVAW